MKKKHRVRWCDGCETDMVVCGTCGNNSCSGGYGRVGGETCTDCPSAYDLHDLMQKSVARIKFPMVKKVSPSLEL